MVFSSRWVRGGLGLLLVVSLAACSSDDSSGGPDVRRGTEPSLEVIRPPVLRDQARHPELDSELIDVEVFEDRLLFTYSSAPEQPPAEGEVVAGVRDGGYLRRILSVNALSAERFELGTESAFLTDYFEDLHFKATFEPPTDAWVEGDGVGARSDALGGSVNLIKTEVAPGCDLESGAVEVGADFAPSFEMEVDISWRAGLKEFRFLVGGDLEIFTALRSGEATLGCNWEHTFESLQKEFTSTFAIGFVPVVVTHTLVPEGKYSLSGSVQVPQVEFEARGGVGFNGGAIYEDGAWSPVADGTRTGNVTFSIEEGGNVTITSRLTAGVNYQAKLYDLAGPQMNLGPYVEGQAMSDLCMWNANADVGLQLNIGARADIPIIDYSLAEYNSGPIDVLSGTFWSDEGTWPWCADGAMPEVDGGTVSMDGGAGDPCEAFSDCDSCTANTDVACGWCDGACMAESRAGECSGEFQDSRSSCVDCASFGDCGSCVPNGFCGWCPGMGCLNDESSEAAACGASYQPSTCG